MGSERTEEYLEAIFKRQEAETPVSTSALAEDLKVSLPAVTDMTMGIALLFEVFRQDALFPNDPAGPKDKTFFSYRATLGALGIAAAVIHFFLPERPFF